MIGTGVGDRSEEHRMLADSQTYLLYVIVFFDVRHLLYVIVFLCLYLCLADKVLNVLASPAPNCSGIHDGGWNTNT